MALVFPILLFVGMPCVYFPNLIDPVHHSRTMLLMIFLLVGFVYMSAIKKKLIIPSNLFSLFWLGYLIISGLSILKATNLVDSQFEFGKLVLVTLLILFCYNALSYKVFNLNTVSLCIAFEIFFQSLLAITQKLKWFEVFGSEFGYLGTLTHQNQFSIHLLICLPFVIYCCLQFKNWIRWFSFSVLFLNIVLLVVIKTRSAWVGLIVMLGFFIIDLISNTEMRKKIFDVVKQFKIYFFSLGGLSLIILTFVVVKDFSEITNHILSFKNMDSNGRFHFWNESINLIKENPLFGVGVGNWRLNVKSVFYEEIFSGMFWQRPHNDYLWILAEVGILGFLLFIGSIIFAFYKLHVFQWQKENKLKLEPLIIAISLIGFLTVSFFSFPKERVLHLIIFSFNIAYIIYLTKPLNKKEDFQLGPIYSYSAIILVLISIGYFTVNRVIAESKLASLMDSDNITPQYHLKKLKSIDQKYFNIDSYSTPLDFHIGLAHLKLNDIKKANQYFQSAYDLYSYQQDILVNLATSYSQLGQEKKGREIYEETARAYPKYGPGLINLAIIAYREKNMEEVKRLIDAVDVRTLKRNQQLVKAYHYLKKAIGEEKP